MNITGCYPFESFCEDGYKTYWFYNKYYRANLLYQNGALWFRDIYKFDENFAEKYVDRREDTPNSVYENLPVMDGYKWSRDDIRAGIYFYNKNGILKSENITYTAPDENTLTVAHNFKNNENIRITFKDDLIKIEGNTDYFMSFAFGKGVTLPVKSVENSKINYLYRDYEYSIVLIKGKFNEKDGTITTESENGTIIFQI
jgi:hypothetical protein